MWLLVAVIWSNMSTVPDSSKIPEETYLRLMRSFLEKNLRSRRYHQKSQYISLLLRKRSHLRFFFPIGLNLNGIFFTCQCMLGSPKNAKSSLTLSLCCPNFFFFFLWEIFLEMSQFLFSHSMKVNGNQKLWLATFFKIPCLPQIKKVIKGLEQYDSDFLRELYL